MTLTEIQTEMRRVRLPEKYVPIDAPLVGECWASLREWRNEVRAFIGRDSDIRRLDDFDELLNAMDAFTRGQS